MFNVFSLEAKREEEAIEKAKEYFALPEDQIYYAIEEESKGLFQGKKYKIKAISKKEVYQKIESFIQNMGTLMNLDLTVEIFEKSDIIYCQLQSSNNSILIGPSGKTLEAFDVYIGQLIYQVKEFGKKISVDIAGYKEKKLKDFEEEIHFICNDVLETEIPVKLDPMNSYKRRLVHHIVSQYPTLKTYSYGEEPSRYIEITVQEK